MAELSPARALEAARVAREAGRLSVAVKAVDHAYATLPRDPGLKTPLAMESEVLARELALRGASLGALGLWLRAERLGKPQLRSILHMTSNYSAWRPQYGSVGAPKDSLQAGASGAFWIGLEQKARVLALQGGITGEGTEPFARVLQLACEGVSWVFVDMEGVNYVGSAGLAMAVKISERLRQRGGGLSMFGLTSNLRILVETLGLGSYLNPVGSLKEVLEVSGAIAPS